MLMFGHVARIPDNVPAKWVLRVVCDVQDGVLPFPNWRRSRGRPPITWLHQICSDCGLPAGDALNCAQDRAVWRTYATAFSASRWRRRRRRRHADNLWEDTAALTFAKSGMSPLSMPTLYITRVSKFISCLWNSARRVALDMCGNDYRCPNAHPFPIPSHSHSQSNTSLSFPFFPTYLFSFSSMPIDIASNIYMYI